MPGPRDPARHAKESTIAAPTPNRDANTEPRLATALMVHGAGGGGWEWRVWAEVFRSGGSGVLAPDLRPGRDGLASTGLADYQDQVQEWLRDMESPVWLIGASLGGLLALAAAGGKPAALVLVNPVPPAGMTGPPVLTPRPAIVAWSSSAFAKTRAALPDAGLSAVRWTHARWRDESGRALNEAAQGWPIQEVPNCRILVLAAAEDRDVPAAGSRQLADHLRADHVEIPGCSHLGILLGHKAAATAVLALAWLRGNAA